MCYEYDPKYPDTTTTENNEGFIQRKNGDYEEKSVNNNLL